MLHHLAASGTLFVEDAGPKIELYYNVSINIKKLFSFGNSFYKFIETISFWK